MRFKGSCERCGVPVDTLMKPTGINLFNLNFFYYLINFCVQNIFF